jgi:hypothetical protein
MSLTSPSTQLNVIAQTAPTWFANQTDSTWFEIPSSIGTLNSVLLSPGTGSYPVIDTTSPHPNAICDAFTGAWCDQTRKEYGIAASGGHGDGLNNSGYAITLTDAAPAWRRLSDATPDAQLGPLTASNGNGIFADGRARAMHASNTVYGDDRVWWGAMSSVTCGSGAGADRMVSYNRGMLGAGTTPLPWTIANLGPFEFWPSPNTWPGGTPSTSFGGAVWDSVTHTVVHVVNGQASSGGWWQRINSLTGAQSTYTTGSNILPSWIGVAEALRIVVVGDSFMQRIAVLDIAANTWSFPSATGTPYFGSSALGAVGTGCVYVPANHCFAVAAPANSGDTIYRLVAPVNANGTYNAGGTWVWSSFTATGGPVNGLQGSGNGTASRWNTIYDMGGGRQGIFMQGSISSGMYCYKVPALGL